MYQIQRGDDRKLLLVRGLGGRWQSWSTILRFDRRNLAAGDDIADPHFHDIAAAKLAVDREV